MMLVVVSDLHLENYNDPDLVFNQVMEFDENDYSDCVAVFAGDIMDGYRACDFLERYVDKFRRVLYVPGNHDLWKSSTSMIGSHEFDIAGKSIVIDDVRFTGAVGWPVNHVRQRDIMDSVEWATALNECREIKHNGGPFDYDSMLQLGERDMNHIFRTESFERIHVAISHYPPSHKSVSPGFEKSKLNYLFHSDYDQIGMFEQTSIDVFIHGHIHHGYDYTINNTRVICNPLGYNWEYRPFTVRFLEL